MEVSGQKNSTKGKRTLCYICVKQNKQIEALQYCKNCKIHLCGSCVQTHRTARTSSFHTLNRSPSVGAKDPLPTCPEHEKETVKFYCRQHDMLGCVACMISHKECDTAYIPDISEQFLKSEDFFQYKVFSEELKTRFADSMRKTEENTSIVDIACRQALEVVQNIKKEFIDCLEKFEIELRDEVMSFKNANEDKLMKIKSDLDQLYKTNLETEALIARLEKEHKCNALFFEVKRAEKHMLDCHESLYEISTRNKVKTILCLPSTDLESLMNKEKLFGIIDIIDSKADSLNTLEYFEKQHIGKVNIHSKEDKKPCYATGLAFLSNDLLAIADQMNQKVKLVDVNQDKIVSAIMFTSAPTDLTAIPPDKIAVTMSKEKHIQMLTTQRGLVATEKFKTNGKCLGVKFDDGKLIVTYGSSNNPNIEILNLNGDVLCKFNTSESRSAAVTKLAAIALSPDHQQMYITGTNKSIHRLSRLGALTGSNILYSYTGVAVSVGGSVYASSETKNKILQLSDDLSTCEEVLSKTEGIEAPLALAFDRVRNRLYVSCGSTNAATSNTILVFQVKLESIDAVLYTQRP